jgi:hypothetical protein
VDAYYRATRDGRYEGVAVPGWVWFTTPLQGHLSKIFRTESLAQGRRVVDAFIDAQDAMDTMCRLRDQLQAATDQEEKEALLREHFRGRSMAEVERNLRIIQFLLKRERQG